MNGILPNPARLGWIGTGRMGFAMVVERTQ